MASRNIVMKKENNTRCPDQLCSSLWTFLFLTFVCSQARHQVLLAFLCGEKIKRPRGRAWFVADGRYELISH